MKRFSTSAAAAALLVLGCVQNAAACRIIEPIPIPIVRPPRPVTPTPLQTKEHRATLRVRDQVAEVTVEAVFHNPNAFRMEGTYWFPLPADAAVRDFRMLIDGKEVKGELLDAERARQTYEDIVRRLEDPALLEWIDSQMLKCRVFPMEPHSDTRVTLSYTQLLAQDSGFAQLRYPLRSARSEGGPLGRLVMDVTIETEAPLKTVYSPTHDFDIAREGLRRARLTLEEKDVDPAHDVEVLYSQDVSDIGLAAVSHNPREEPGYFLLSVAPAVEVAPSQVLPKNLVFVCDTSGSMREDGKIEQARRALKFCVASLNPDDRFTVIAFSGEVRAFRDGLVSRSPESVEAAGEFIAGLEAVGGTALNDAVKAAMQAAAKAEGVAMVILVTDGNPTIGEQNVEKILENIRQANESRSRLFVFGVGYDVNTRLLDSLAEQNRGTREYVKPGEDLEVKISRFYSKIANPVLSDVRLEFGEARVEQVYPRSLPDLFQGSQLTVLGRYRTAGAFGVALSGEVNGRRKEFRRELVLSDGAEAEYLPRLWALRKVAFLLDEIRLHGENAELVDEVKRLGKRHGILTPYTSFLVMDDSAAAPAPVRRELEALERVGAARFRAPTQQGRGAVADSAELARAKGQGPGGGAGVGYGSAGFGLGATAGEDAGRRALVDFAREAIRHLGAKTFYVKAGGLWVDSMFDESGRDPVRDVTPWSEEFFRLADKHPVVGQVLAEAKQAVIVLEGRAYRFTGKQTD